MLRRLSVVTMLAIVGTGAALAAEPVPYATCLNTQGTCMAYVGRGTQSMLGYTIKSCQGPNNKWATRTKCPEANRLGICKNDRGKSNEIWTVVYKTNYTSAAQAKMQCERDLGGKWFPQ
jgi:hypothetical protein